MADTHRLEASAWSNVLATLPPALRVKSGDSLVTETLDAAGVDARGRQKASPPNPMNGPVFVEGAEPGDALRVEIVRVEPVRGGGWTRAALSANVVDPEAVRDLPPRDRVEWLIDRDAGTVRLEAPEPGLAGLVLPLAPMIGCFGVAPAHGQAISTASSGRNGGNMDWRGFVAGCVVSFPVFVPGALFFLGDCHAVQGDGEIVGTGVETCCEVAVRLTVEKGRAIGWPRGESERADLHRRQCAAAGSGLAACDHRDGGLADGGLWAHGRRGGASPRAGGPLRGRQRVQSGLYHGVQRREAVAAARELGPCDRSSPARRLGGAGRACRDRALALFLDFDTSRIVGTCSNPKPCRPSQPCRRRPGCASCGTWSLPVPRGWPPALVAERVEVSASNVSFHLKELERAGLVRALAGTGARSSMAPTMPASPAWSASCWRTAAPAIPKSACRPPTAAACCASPENLMITHGPYNVLFLCTGNSARSILAEAILDREGRGRFRGFSAGSHPKGEVHPYALDLLKRLNHDTAFARSKSWDEFAAPGAPRMDFVFTVCDQAAAEECPYWPGQPMTAHWGVPDPAAAEGNEAEKRLAFSEAYRMLRNRISIFVNLPLASHGRAGPAGAAERDRPRPDARRGRMTPDPARRLAAEALGRACWWPPSSAPASWPTSFRRTAALRCSATRSRPVRSSSC